MFVDRYVQEVCRRLASGSLTRSDNQQLSTLLGKEIREELPLALSDPGLEFAPGSEITVIGGFRRQQIDVVGGGVQTFTWSGRGRRVIALPFDGIRIAIEAKSLNTRESIGKNYNNMIMDIAATALNIHMRYPMACVGIVVALSADANRNHVDAIVQVLESLNERTKADEPFHLYESCGLFLYDCATETANREVPAPTSSVHMDQFIQRIVDVYRLRYPV
jgi:hypothetical protein